MPAPPQPDHLVPADHADQCDDDRGDGKRQLAIRFIAGNGGDVRSITRGKGVDDLVVGVADAQQPPDLLPPVLTGDALALVKRDTFADVAVHLAGDTVDIVQRDALAVAVWPDLRINYDVPAITLDVVINDIQVS